MTLDDMLALVREAPYGGDGVGLAYHYAGALGPCLADTLCVNNFFGSGNQRDWSSAVKESNSKLVYSDPAMRLLASSKRGGQDLVTWGKRFDDTEPSLDPKFLMEFDCVATSTRKDRDADVLEVTGSEPDERAPLLWQHLPLLPLGPVRAWGAVVPERQIRPARCGVLDTNLGHDACTLVEGGALRVSHGFLPLEFEPLKKDAQRDKDDPRTGWHVKRYKILELSLVSVPSNEDAIITAWSREKLTHPLVKAWAQELRSQLPALVKGGWQTPGPATRTGAGTKQPCTCGHVTHTEPVKGLTDKPYAGESACRLAEPSGFADFRRQNRKGKDGKTRGFVFGKKKDSSKWELQSVRYPTGDWTVAEAKAACAKAGGKFEPAKGKFLDPAEVAASEPDVKQEGVCLLNRDGVLMPHLEGSWEQVEATLEEKAKDWLKAGQVSTDGDVCLIGTYDGYGVVAVRSYYGSGYKMTCYRGDWSGDADEVAWEGAPEPVDIVTTVGAPDTEKAVYDVLAKGKIARRHHARLKEAHSLMGTVSRAKELEHSTRAMAEKAHALAGTVVLETGPGAPVEGDPKKAAAVLTGLLMAGGEAGAYAEGLLGLLEAEVAARKKAAEEEALAEILG